jgi:hypothetical protein
MANIITSESRIRAQAPTKFGFHPHVEERLRAFGMDPEEFAKQFGESRRAELARKRKLALALTPGDITVAGPVAQAAMMYESNSYVADAVCNVQLVTNRTGTYFLYKRDQQRSLIETRVAPQAKSKEITPEMTSATYLVEDHSLQDVVPGVTDAANPSLRLRARGAERVTDRLLLMREYRVATLMNTTANFAAANVFALGAAYKWNGGASADPIKDVLGALEVVRGNVNTAIMSDIVWHAVQQNASIKAILASQFNNQGLLRTADFGLYFGIPNVIITKAEYEDSTGARKRIWSESNMQLLNVNDMEDERTFARTFRWRQGAGGFVATGWWDPERGPNGAWIEKVTHADTEVVIANDYGAIITGVKQ